MGATSRRASSTSGPVGAIRSRALFAAPADFADDGGHTNTVGAALPNIGDL
jgi:hypothetical protein